MCLKISLILKAEWTSCVRFFDLNLWHTILGITFWMIRSTFVQQFLLSNLTSKWRPNAQGLASYYKHNIQQQKLQGNTYLRLTVTTLHEHAPFTVHNYLSLFDLWLLSSFSNISYHKHITRNNHNKNNNKNNPAKQIYKSKQSILLQRLNNKQMNKSSRRRRRRDSQSKQESFHIKWQTFF